MFGLNAGYFIGRVGRDPELKYTGNGSAMLKFTIAVTEPAWKKESEPSTTWFNVVMWGKLAETLNNFLAKGQEVFIEGKMECAKYEKDGQKKEFWQINARRVAIFPDLRGHGAGGQARPSSTGDDDIPF